MSQLQISSSSQSAPIFIGEVLEGEIVDIECCSRCDGYHVIDGERIECCCGVSHDVEFCCDCGHFHSGSWCPQAPCGDYRCCID